jgi:Ca2+-binding RTX toxin-like protein
VSSVTSSIWIDRDSGTFDLSIDYWIDPYIDPETGEYFGDTSWTLTYGSGGTGGWGGEAGTVPINLGLAGGEDLVSSTLSFSATNTFSGVSVEQQWNLLVAAYATGDLTANGGAGSDIVITGSGNDTVFGNDGDDILNTGDGNDTLDGGDGADQLDGGRGDDTLIGGGGDDFYMVGSAGDVVVELAGGGNDVVMSSISYTLADEVEQLILNGVGPLDGTGNAGNNQLYGNHDINVLSGLAGQDLLSGYDGADMLFGGSGNDTLDGGGGGDVMDGGADDDTYIVDSAGDAVIELAGGGVDTVQVFGLASYTLADEVENLTLLWGGDFQGTGNDQANVLMAGIYNDTLLGLGGDDLLQGGDGNDTLDGGRGADRLVGGAGFDTASYASAAGGISLNFATGGRRGDAFGDTFEGIERVVGSAFADVMIGDANANQLFGGSGNDRIQGGAGADMLVGGGGADQLRGGTGEDWVSYVGSAGAVTVNLGARAVAGGDAEGDTISGFENAAGGNGDDFLTGNSAANRLFGDGGADTIRGRAGDDTIEGGAGADMLFGGNGLDRLSYASSALAVTINLGTGAASGGDAEGDGYIGFEGAIGSAFADTITAGPAGSSLAGGDGDDTLTGGDGDDTIEGGAGADLMDGGGGIDTLSYAELGGWVSVSLFSGTAYQYFSTSDTFANVENVIGSAYGDSIYGNDVANKIDGGDGGDFIAGYGGNDLLTGGEGDDFFYFDGIFGSDIILDFHAGDDMEDEIGLGLGFDFDSLAEVMAVATQSGPDTILSFTPERQLTLVGVNLAALTPNDFYFN